MIAKFNYESGRGASESDHDKSNTQNLQKDIFETS